MNRKKWTVVLAAAVLVALTVAGYFSISAEYGTQEDPLVTLSYINEVLAPETMSRFKTELELAAAQVRSEVETDIRTASDVMDAKIIEYQTAVQNGSISDELVDTIAGRVVAQMASQGGGEQQAKAPVWQVIKLAAGKKITCSIGCELVLRIGKATCVSSGTTGPINLTDGTVLAPDAEYLQNNLYLVTIEGRGLKTADGCTVLICGDFVIS